MKITTAIRNLFTGGYARKERKFMKEASKDPRYASYFASIPKNSYLATPTRPPVPTPQAPVMNAPVNRALPPRSIKEFYDRFHSMSSEQRAWCTHNVPGLNYKYGTIGKEATWLGGPYPMN